MKSRLIALAAAGALASGIAVAGPGTLQHGYDAGAARMWHAQSYARWDDRSANVDEREARIHARIQRGLGDGRITHREARRLFRQLANIEATEHGFKADGWLTRREEALLDRDLDRLAANVRVQLRDEERRY